MKKDKLEVGLIYWLDIHKDVSGEYRGNIDGEILFKRVSGDSYSEDENGLINFSEWDQDFFLVSKNPIN